MKPVIILPPDLMSAEDVKELRDNGFCVVEAKDPKCVRFMDPIASAADRPKIEQAAIELSRLLLNGMWGSYTPNGYVQRGEIARMFVDCLISGTPLARVRRQDEEQEIFDDEKERELRRLAREEAKQEREAAKAAKAAKEKKP